MRSKAAKRIAKRVQIHKIENDFKGLSEDSKESALKEAARCHTGAFWIASALTTRKQQRNQHGQQARIRKIFNGQNGEGARLNLEGKFGGGPADRNWGHVRSLRPRQDKRAVLKYCETEWTLYAIATMGRAL